MTIVKTPIIPTHATYIGAKKNLDYKAICVFSALGFFLDDDTFYLEQKVLKPGCDCEFEGKQLRSQRPYFEWHYSPKERDFEDIVSEFGALFETIITEQTKDKKVILPLSGGLDSRTQAVALAQLGVEVQAYSYSFQDGLNESDFGKQIAEACGFPFQDFTVPEGYLWPCVEDLARINGCYSEFTHPRQMAFITQYAAMGDVFSLGHWGDVLFDDMGVPEDMPFELQVDLLIKKVVKKGGLELATSLWHLWGMEGCFEAYLRSRISALHKSIPITKSANARIRAFKSLYWAPRWTSVNLSVFEAVRPVTLPYYDNRMCEFICTVPERYLAGRQIQIAYIKQRLPEVARIAWQDHRPFNLYNYHKNKMPFNLPFRVFNKLKRSLQLKPYVTRNWELQFVSKTNAIHLEAFLFNADMEAQGLSKSKISRFYEAFKTQDAVTYSHPVSMLLTLSLFFKQHTS